MSSPSWRLNRRTMLRGSGLGLALPLLDAMRPVAAAAASELPKRMVVCYFSYGAYMPKTDDGSHHPWNWFPCSQPGPLTFNESSAPFKPFADSVSYFRGLDHAGGWKLGGHSSGDVFATGADMTGPEKTNNISIDQVAAKARGHETRYPSLVLGTEGGTGSYGRCKTLSHYGPGRPIPSLHRPQEIFNRVFRPYADRTVEQLRAELKRDASVLDLMLEHSRSLQRRLGSADNRKLDEYLDSVRALEQRTERSSRWTHQPLPDVDTKGLDIEASYGDPAGYIRCMYDLLYLALQTDSTRYATLMLESEQSVGHETGKFASIVLGYGGATHDIAHKRPIESGHWDRWRAEQHAHFLRRLADTPEGEGSMLDRTVVLWGSAHPHGSHGTRDYPIQLAGGNALGLRHGRLHAFEGSRKVPLANLFVSMLESVGVPTPAFADSTGPLSEIMG